MTKEEKLKYFEYMIWRCLLSYQDIKGNVSKNNFNRTKCLLLTFFVTSANTLKNSSLLDNVFDNFIACPHGNIEKDLQEIIGNSIFFDIPNNNSSLSIKNNNLDLLLEGLNEKYIIDINDAILHIQSSTKNFILYSAGDLLDLNHTFFSWKSSYSIAKKLKKFTLKVHHNSIKQESKYFLSDNWKL